MGRGANTTGAPLWYEILTFFQITFLPILKILFV